MSLIVTSKELRLVLRMTKCYHNFRFVLASFVRNLLNDPERQWGKEVLQTELWVVHIIAIFVWKDKHEEI
jgi:hypothetical protein